MSTITSNKTNNRLREEDLAEYFRRFFKSGRELLIGVEAELLGIHSENGLPVSYEEPGGIEDIFSDLTDHFGWEPIQESGHAIALRKESHEIHLEPGGQLEFSCRPYKSIRENYQALQILYADLKTVSSERNISWLELGLRPFGKAEDIHWVPKFRYQIMKNYLQGRGKLSHRMMKQTCTLQINLDYSNEQEAMKKMRTGMAIAPIMTGLFANSPLLEGKFQNVMSLRAQAWLDTDPARCGLIPDIFSDDPSFEDYVRYLLQVPMIFIVKEGRWQEAGTITFDRYLKFGHEGHYPTETDWRLFLTTIFTDVRLNPYVELRFADRNRLDLNMGMAAFWKGLLYDAGACEATWKLLKKWAWQERVELSRNAPVLGPRAEVRGKTVLEWGIELLNYAERGLKNIAADQHLDEETKYLEPVKILLLEEKQCPAEKLLHLWNHVWHENPRKLIEYAAI